MSTIYTVTQLNNHCKSLLDRNFNRIWIKGEVSNPKIYSSGHLYFTLKDNYAQLSCVFFNFSNIDIVDGDELTVFGNVTLYTGTGRYQLIVKEYYHSGKGIMFKQFNILKEKLLKEGLFEPRFKKELPLFPKKIGIITSIDGAVIQDMLDILNRRAPYIEIFVRNCKVQGDDSSESIINSLEDFKLFNTVDLIIIARGGGSFEDLMPFNDERLVRKIFDIDIPIISSVGHETDFTLCDFVSDIRAATPSVAAEIISDDKNELLLKLDSFLKIIENNIYEKLNFYMLRINLLNAKIPTDPQLFIDKKIDLLKYKTHIINSKIITIFDNYISYLNSRIDFLNLSNPENLKKKGYSLVKINNKIINDIKKIKENDLIEIDMFNGNIMAIVKTIINNRV